jgi:hypothetical protein
MRYPRLTAARRAALLAGVMVTVLLAGCGSTSTQAALASSAGAYARLMGASHAFARNAKGCTASSHSLACVEAGDEVMSRAYARFAAAIAAIPMPSGDPQTAAAQVEEAAKQTSRALRALRSGGTLAGYHIAFASSPVLGDASVLQEDYGYLHHLLTS